MKKIFKFILFGYFVTVLFSACQKCTVCTYIDQSTGEEIIDEFCGPGKQVDDYEAQWVEDWILNGGYCRRY
jgi:hypothetical protein